jgi:glycine cleavage system H protein
MSKIPENLRYTKEHEWAREGGDGVIVIGITDYAQDALGDITYLELPEPGTSVSAGDTFGVVESVKTFSDLYAPVSGEVVAVNEELSGSPERVNQDAYAAWMFRVRPSNPAELNALLDAAAYEKVVASDQH